MQIIENDPLDKHIDADINTIEKNPYLDKISFEERLQIILEALYDDSKMTHFEFKKYVEKALQKV